MARPSPELVERFRGDLGRLAGGQAGRVAVAVSGGPDSLALLLLAGAAFPREVRAATVDHGLRPASAAEAVHVATLCSRLGVPHRTLPVKVQSNARGIQAAARDARYAALGAWMAQEGVSILLTAHHLDDQAETLLMRLMRGSGVAGLAGIRAVAPFPAGGERARLCRPLLAWRRAELAELVESAGIRAIDDPSNVDPAFDRARLRARLSETPWLHAAPLARSAAALAAAEEALQWAVDRLEAERIAGDGDGFTLDPSGLPSELVRRLVRRVLSFLDAASEARGEQLTRLIETLEAGGTATLAGAKATGGPLWRFERAPPRRID